MGALVWVMMGLALWHFTIFVPDRFWAGIVGAFLGAVLGAPFFGLAIHGFSVPGQNDTDLITALEAIPGALIGIAAVYLYGASQGNEPLFVRTLAPIADESRRHDRSPSRSAAEPGCTDMARHDRLAGVLGGRGNAAR
jgi:hypothetical protein